MSLIVPIHGAAPFLNETLGSVSSVPYLNLEVLLVLDRPTPTARSIVTDYCRKNSRAIWIESKEPGISSALNTGLAIAKGELISRLDCDDLILPARIQMQVEEFMNRPKLVLVGTQMRIINAQGDYIRKTRYPLRNRSIKKLMEIRNCVGHPTVMFRKFEALRVGGYRGEFNGAEDLDLWLRLSHEGEFKTINQALTAYRISDFQETKKIKKNPGELEEKVILTEWDSSAKSLRQFLKTRFFFIRLNSGESQFQIPLWKILRLISIRALWRADFLRKISKLRALKALLEAIVFSPAATLRFTIYVFLVKLNARKKLWN